MSSSFREGPPREHDRRVTSSRDGEGAGFELPAPAGIEVESVEWHGQQRLVISFPLPKPKWPPALTRAERAVAALVLEGRSNAQIASRRGTSERTVVNQVASVFKKASVASRTELAARVFGS